MSINRNRIRQARDNHEYRILFLKEAYPPYWGEGMYLYPRKAHCWAKSSNKGLMSYQLRMYKTWKHNRKTQWKKACVVDFNE